MIISDNSQLRELLEKVSDSYPEFVTGMLGSCGHSVPMQEHLIEVLKRHPEATTDDVYEYIFSIQVTQYGFNYEAEETYNIDDIDALRKELLEIGDLEADIFGE